MTKTDWGRYAWMRDYWWAVYPVMTVLFIIFSFRIIGDIGGSWTEAERKQRVVEEGRRRAETLKRKLAVLETIPEGELRRDLARLVETVPASKQLFAAVAELKLAATVAGVKLDKYSAKVGEIREATMSAQETPPIGGDLEMSVSLTVFDLFQLKGFLSTLERQLPLMRVGQIRYTASGVEMTVEQPVSQWERQNLNIDTPLPDYQARLTEVNRKLQFYESLPKEQKIELEIGEDAATSGGRLF